jgi:BirA family biotin operon repressor/biotin-[acetyl-CoA-carboxylase] ligase
MKTPLLRTVILRFDSLPSTNTEAARQATLGAAEGLCVVAREQTRGRGRRERVWVSPVDAGLYLSVVLRPAALAPEAWPLITLAAALAVREALAQTFALDVDIKWPNDIVAGERKLCGILAETVETEAGRAVILGIGVNLDDRAFPPELRETATSIASLTGSAPDAAALLQALLGALSRRYALLQAENGRQETIDAWSRHSSYARDRRVRVSLATETFDGLTRGLEPDGALRVETDRGEIRTVRAGDVTSLRKRSTEY